MLYKILTHFYCFYLIISTKNIYSDISLFIYKPGLITIKKKMNTKSVAELIFLIFGGAIVGITGNQWISIAAEDGVLKVDKLIFSMCFLTCVFAIAWIILFLLRSSNKLLGFVSFVLIILVIIFWFSLTIFVATRKF